MLRGLSLMLAGWLGVVCPALRAATPEEIGAHIDAFMLTHGLPGVQVGIWQNGTPWAIYEKGYADVATLEPTSADQYYRIASVTKSFTVTRVLQLAGNGTIDLDAPVSTYLPGVVTGLGNNGATIRQLANMTSGIVSYTKTQAALDQLVNHPADTVTDQTLVDFSKTLSPTNPPGGPWEYSNTNTILLGMVVEAMTGNSIGDEIQTNILNPLGLTHTYYPQPDELVARNPYAHGYDAPNPTAADDVSNVFSPSLFSSAGTMVSTLGDLRVWSEALAKGTLLTPAMHAEQLEWVDAGSVVDGPYYDLYGLGIGSINGWLGHTGERPGYQSLVMYDPAGDWNVVMTFNSGFNGGHLPTELFLEISPMIIPEPGIPALLVLTAVTGAGLALRRRTRKQASIPSSDIRQGAVLS